MFQTRSEITGIKEFKTLKQAMVAAKVDKSIWKISFWTNIPDIGNGERVRLVRHENEWHYEPILEL